MLPEMAGFSHWHLYRDFFHHRMERGGPLYNSLILTLWKDVLLLAERLGKLIDARGIGLLCTVDVHSTPGNVALALALVLISEHMRVPVIAINRDFYWEGGAAARREFFTNSHLGEVFSIMQVMYPWAARTWISANTSREQSEHLVRRLGHSPANVTELGNAATATLESLTRKFEACLRQLHRQLRANDLQTATDAMSLFQRRVRRHDSEVAAVVNTDNREYLPGHGRMGFMLILKSLIDPRDHP